MQRSKLQALVRASVTQQTVSTEGFLGDLVDSVKKLFSGSDRLLTKDEIKKGRVAYDKLADRLKSTVLNDQWLDAAVLNTSVIRAEWAIPGLDYRSSFNSNDPLKHIETAISETTKLAKVYGDAIAKQAATQTAIYNKLIKQVVKAKDDEQLQDNAVDTADAAFDKIVPVKNLLQSHPIETFGNCRFTLKDGKLDKIIAPSKLETLPVLTKPQLKQLAEMLLKLIDANLNGNIYDKADFIDWDGMIHDIMHEVGNYGDDSAIVDIINKTKLAREGQSHDPFNDPGITSILSAIDLLHIRPLMWMNASIK
jgi:hypothetical protein